MASSPAAAATDPTFPSHPFIAGRSCRAMNGSSLSHRRDGRPGRPRPRPFAFARRFPRDVIFEPLSRSAPPPKNLSPPFATFGLFKERLPRVVTIAGVHESRRPNPPCPQALPDRLRAGCGRLRPSKPAGDAAAIRDPRDPRPRRHGGGLQGPQKSLKRLVAIKILPPRPPTTR